MAGSENMGVRLGWQSWVVAVGALAVVGAGAAVAAPTYGPIPAIQGPPTWVPHQPVQAPLSTSEFLLNGDFETGNFSGWTVLNEVEGDGDWFVYSGTVSPFSGFTIAAPPQGRFAATSDQGGPGSHILYQDVALPAGSKPTLSFIIYYENHAGVFFTPASLDFGVDPNQQYRIDIMDPAAPIGSVAPGDVLANVFQTSVGDPAVLDPTPIAFNLTPFAGRTVRLRFAEVDNQSFFQASVDAVSVSTGAPAPVLSRFGLACLSVVLLFIGVGCGLRSRSAA